MPDDPSSDAAEDASSTPSSSGTAAPRGGRPTWVVVVAVVTVLAAVTAVALAVTGRRGGASDPTEAAEQFFDGLASADLVGTLETLAPDERDALVGATPQLLEQLRRLGLVAATDGRPVAGLTVRPETLQFRTVKLAQGTEAVDVIAGRLTVTADDKLPVTAAGRDVLEELGLDPTQDGGTLVLHDFAQTPLRLVAVDAGGGWHISLQYTVAEALRPSTARDAAIGGGPAPVGAADPEAAVRELVAAYTAGDRTKALGLLDPTDAAVFADYVKVFVPDIDTPQGEGKVNDLELRTTGDGAQRTVTVTKLDLDLNDQVQTIHVVAEGECFTTDYRFGDADPYARFRTCGRGTDTKAIGAAAADPNATAGDPEDEEREREEEEEREREREREREGEREREREGAGASTTTSSTTVDPDRTTLTVPRELQPEGLDPDGPTTTLDRELAGRLEERGRSAERDREAAADPDAPTTVDPDREEAEREREEAEREREEAERERAGGTSGTTTTTMPSAGPERPPIKGTAKEAEAERAEEDRVVRPIDNPVSALALFGNGSQLPPITVVQRDGRWYVSPVHTLVGGVVATLEAAPDASAATALIDQLRTQLAPRRSLVLEEAADPDNILFGPPAEKKNPLVPRCFVKLATVAGEYGVEHYGADCVEHLVESGRVEAEDTPQLLAFGHCLEAEPTSPPDPGAGLRRIYLTDRAVRSCLQEAVDEGRAEPSVFDNLRAPADQVCFAPYQALAADAPESAWAAADAEAAACAAQRLDGPSSPDESAGTP